MKEALRILGFTPHESLVYSEALKIGSCSIQQLAHNTGLNRITVHSIVDKFERQQIFSRSYEGRRRRVSPVEPSRLRHLLEEEERAVQNKKDALDQILPTLVETYRQTRRGLQVFTFQGEKGFEQMCADVLQSKTEVLEYAHWIICSTQLAHTLVGLLFLKNTNYKYQRNSCLLIHLAQENILTPTMCNRNMLLQCRRNLSDRMNFRWMPSS